MSNPVADGMVFLVRSIRNSFRTLTKALPARQTLWPPPPPAVATATFGMRRKSPLTCDNREVTSIDRHIVVSPYRYSARTLACFYRLECPLIVTHTSDLTGVRLSGARIWWDHPDLIDPEITELLTKLAAFEGRPLAAFDALAALAD